MIFSFLIAVKTYFIQTHINKLIMMKLNNNIIMFYFADFMSKHNNITKLEQNRKSNDLGHAENYFKMPKITTKV